MHRDAYQLRNLPLAHKLWHSAALLLGLSLFMATGVAALTVLRWSFSDRALLLEWGASLSQLGRLQPRLYLLLMGLSLAGQGLLFVVSRRLFGRTALRHRVRRLLERLGGALLLANALVWLALPRLELARVAALPVIALMQAALVVYAVVPLWQMWVYHRFRGRGGGRHRVVIVGGGFAGLNVALELDRLLGHVRELEVVLVDRNNYFLFPPLLPSAATGAIETRQVTYPFRRIFETTNIRFEKAVVERVDLAGKTLHTSAGKLCYDYLLLCPGATVNSFRTPGVRERALFLRELEDAVLLRNRIIDCFERAAALDRLPAEQAELLRFVVVGGGPTGVEVATEIHDLIYRVLLKRYPEIDPKLVDVCLVHSGSQVLPGWNPRVVSSADRQLSSLRIRLLFETRVTALGADQVELSDGTRLATRNCIWCAGVRPSPLLEATGLRRDRSGRAVVEPDLRAAGESAVFVLGDSASLTDERRGGPLPPLGQVAFQQGPHAARNVVRLLEGRPTRRFRYFDYGSLVSVGEHCAAVDLMGLRLSGFVGWFVWRSLYLVKLVGLSNKLRVMLDWTLDLLVERSFSQIAEPRSSTAAGAR